MDFRSNEADRIALRLPIRLCLSSRTSERSQPHFLVVTTQERGSRSFDMDDVRPADIAAQMMDASAISGARRHAATAQ